VCNEKAAHGCSAQLARTQTGRECPQNILATKCQEEGNVWGKLSAWQRLVEEKTGGGIVWVECPRENPGECPDHYTGLQASTCSIYDLCHPGWHTHKHTQTDSFWPVILLAQPDEIKTNKEWEWGHTSAVKWIVGIHRWWRGRWSVRWAWLFSDGGRCRQLVVLSTTLSLWQFATSSTLQHLHITEHIMYIHWSLDHSVAHVHQSFLQPSPSSVGPIAILEKSYAGSAGQARPGPGLSSRTGIW